MLRLALCLVNMGQELQSELRWVEVGPQEVQWKVFGGGAGGGCVISCAVCTLLSIDAFLIEMPIFVTPVTSKWFLDVLTYHNLDI